MNDKALEMVWGRLSSHIKTFNSYDVTMEDSDAHYDAIKERSALAAVALARSSDLRVTTLARSLGDIYRAIRRNLNIEELMRWNSTAAVIDNLHDKYGM